MPVLRKDEEETLSKNCDAETKTALMGVMGENSIPGALRTFMPLHDSSRGAVSWLLSISALKIVSSAGNTLLPLFAGKVITR